MAKIVRKVYKKYSHVAPKLEHSVFWKSHIILRVPLKRYQISYNSFITSNETSAYNLSFSTTTKMLFPFYQSKNIVSYLEAKHCVCSIKIIHWCCLQNHQSIYVKFQQVKTERGLNGEGARERKRAADKRNERWIIGRNWKWCGLKMAVSEKGRLTISNRWNQ